jgi:ribonuclease P protein subunit POP4
MNIRSVASEYIGHDVTVIKSTNHNNAGLKGRVIDETRNMMIIENGGRRLRIPKNGSTFMFNLDGSEEMIDGRVITYTTPDRIKNAQKIIKTFKRRERE